MLKKKCPYDPQMHAAACGIPWYEKYKEKLLNVDVEPFEAEAKMLA
ncbi:hypothetical protein O0535_06605 [Brevibacillus halotolerans]|uniref:Uncharacterized protein n=1 Tax=Brevibacillus halotolerans TaxID=1507437 RepID=A0ABT4HUT2_9BACL|nr:hypothetical protein [Brevibacillus halotolerans]